MGWIEKGCLLALPSARRYKYSLPSLQYINHTWIANPGINLRTDPSAWPLLHAYVADVVQYFKGTLALHLLHTVLLSNSVGDDRIIGYEILNEPVLADSVVNITRAFVQAMAQTIQVQ